MRKILAVLGVVVLVVSLLVFAGFMRRPVTSSGSPFNAPMDANGNLIGPGY